jgi:hypothetical protein
MFNIQYKGIKITKCKKYINLRQNKKALPSTLLQKQKQKQTNKQTNQDTPQKPLSPQIKEEKKTIKKQEKKIKKQQKKPQRNQKKPANKHLKRNTLLKINKNLTS